MTFNFFPLPIAFNISSWKDPFILYLDLYIRYITNATIEGIIVIINLIPIIVVSDCIDAPATYPVNDNPTPINHPLIADANLTNNVCAENIILSFLLPNLYSP